MEILDELREKLNINDDEYKEMENIIKGMEKVLNAKGIYFNDQLKIGFYSHMVSFVRRLKNKELVTDADSSSVLSQIEKENMDLAADLIKPMFKKYGTDYSKEEVILIAIYIQTASND